MDNARRAKRGEAADRARAFSPFLRNAAERQEPIVRCFLDEGAEAASRLALDVAGESGEQQLRRQRLGLALAVALGDLSGDFTLEQVTGLLSDFADAAIDKALRAAVTERVENGGVDGIAVIALGKLGSRELNYSSDVDLLLLFDPERIPRRPREDPGESAVRIGRRFVELLQKRTDEGYVFRVDLRLRPSPEVTPIVLPANAAISYYESSALAWERAAFIRGRPVGGDLALARQFLEAIEPFVWRRSLDFGVIEEINDISARIRDHYAQGSAFGPGYDLKRGLGGIREVEFFAQIHQMIHGGRDPSVRAPATMEALAALAAAGRLAEDDARDLADAYRALRTVEHRVQMVDDAQTHLLPADPAELDRVANLHGLQGGQALLDLLGPKVERVARLFDSLTPEKAERLSSNPDSLNAELGAIGFEDPGSAGRRIADWRSGKVRALRSPAAVKAFEAMLPVLLREIAAGPDPDHALNRFSDIVERLSSGINLFRLLEARPALAKLLATILAHAPALSEQLARRPSLLDGLIDESSFRPPPETEVIAERLSDLMKGQPYDVALDRARRSVNERRFALGVQLIAKRTDPLDVAAGYSRVAEGALIALADLTVAEFEAHHGRFADGELVIVGLGRLGGCALTHASDLDLIYLHTAAPGSASDGAKPLGPADYFNRLANRITAALSVPTAAGPLYDVDTRLRPQGAKGMLAVSLDAFEAYQRDEAWTWEHMALTRARPVYGSASAQGRTAAVIADTLRRARDRGQIAADAARMRSEMAGHKLPSGPLDVKLGEGGLVDLEFAVHVLQLSHGVGLHPHLPTAISELVEANLIDANIVESEMLLTRFLVVLRLVAPAGRDIPPKTTGLAARLCGAENWDELLARLDAARQRVSALWQSVRDGK